MESGKGGLFSGITKFLNKFRGKKRHGHGVEGPVARAIQSCSKDSDCPAGKECQVRHFGGFTSGTCLQTQYRVGRSVDDNADDLGNPCEETMSCEECLSILEEDEDGYKMNTCVVYAGICKKADSPSFQAVAVDYSKIKWSWEEC